MDPEIEGVTLRPVLLASGVTEDELRRWRAADELTALRPGAYLPSDDPRLDDEMARHALLVRTTMRKVSPDAVVSHVSAAVLHGLPLWRVALNRVHVIKDRRSGGHVSALLHSHVANLGGDEIEIIDGIPVTTLTRTLADVACFEAFEQALIPMDAALHHHRTTREDLEEAIERCAGRTGVPRARRVIAFARPGAMSPGESRSRLAIHRAGLPSPELQYVVPGTDAEVDFWWAAQRTAGEFDGRTKYGRLLAPGQSAGDAVFAEKVREDRVRDTTASVVRWTWNELPPAFAPVAVRLRAAFARA